MRNHSAGAGNFHQGSVRGGRPPPTQIRAMCAAKHDDDDGAVHFAHAAPSSLSTRLTLLPENLNKLSIHEAALITMIFGQGGGQQ
jgi:hypothetical protein